MKRKILFACALALLALPGAVAAQMHGGGGMTGSGQNMMGQTDGWMGGWAGGGMWVWTVVGILVVVLLVVAISKLSKK